MMQQRNAARERWVKAFSGARRYLRAEPSVLSLTVIVAGGHTVEIARGAFGPAKVRPIGLTRSARHAQYWGLLEDACRSHTTGFRRHFVESARRLRTGRAA